MSDELRLARNLLTVSTVAKLVKKSLGAVHLLAIVGRCRAGKTWAMKDWIAGRNDPLEHVAYVDCRGIGLGGVGVIAFNESKRELPEKTYPKFALDGVDVVVVDEPHCNPELVKAVLSRTSPAVGASAHRLVVLLVQDTRFLFELGFDVKHTHCYDTEGLAIPLTDPKRSI
jgi:hypothetical protein